MILAVTLIVSISFIVAVQKTLSTAHDMLLDWLAHKDTVGGSAERLQALEGQLASLEDRHADLSMKTRQAMGWK